MVMGKVITMYGYSYSDRGGCDGGGGGGGDGGGIG